MATRRLHVLLLGAIVASFAASSALSRTWKATALQIADEYAQINHGKANGEIVLLKWYAAPTAVPGTPDAALLEKFIVVSVVHFRMELPARTFSFIPVDTLEVRDSSGQPLVLIPRSDLPPAVIANLSGLEAIFKQALGQLGNGIKFFVFDAGAVRACETGGISIPFAGENYTWDTPFPGCAI